MNFYNVLQCNKHSKQIEIRNKYRQLSKIHHPDKGGNAAYFRLINEAYNVLGNKKSKLYYDTELTFRKTVFNARKNTPDTIINIEYTLCDFFIGCTRSISLKRFTHCLSCKNGHNCVKCTNGLVITKENIMCKLERNSMIGSQIIIYGKSNDKIGFNTGNLIVNTSCRPLKNGFTACKSDIIYDLEMSIYDILVGFKRTITHIDGSGKLVINTMKTDKILENQIRYVGKGLLKEDKSRGDLLVRINIKNFNIVKNEDHKIVLRRLLQ